MCVDDNNQLLSVIVPVYNAEKYLGRCVESILKQTYRNIELILIDDGSNDNSPILCDNWAKKDERVSAFHIQNGGPSSARNFGLKLSKGRFVAFVDADDFLNEDMYETLINSLITTDSEMAICKWAVHDLDTGRTEIPNIGKIGSITTSKLKELIVADDVDGGGGYPWNRVIDLRRILNRKGEEIAFREDISVYEDKIWVLEVLDYTRKAIVLDFVGYNYEVHSSSLSQRSYAGKLRDFLSAWEIIEEECFYGSLPISAKKFRAFWIFTYFWKIKKESQYELIKELWPEQRRKAKQILKLTDMRKIAQFIVLDLISFFYKRKLESK